MDNSNDDSEIGNSVPAISKHKALALTGQTAVSDIGAKMRSLANLKPGSETIRTPEMVEAIVVRLLHGEALLSICTDPAMPAPDTVTGWMRHDQELRGLIQWARSEGMEILFDSQLDIAAGGYFSTGDKERDALLIKAINNVTAKRNRAAFGEKTEVTSNSITYIVSKNETDW
jgi:hypothetical protein